MTRAELDTLTPEQKRILISEACGRVIDEAILLLICPLWTISRAIASRRADAFLLKLQREEDPMSEELKPCPFCGGIPVTGCADPGAPYPGGIYYIACENEECCLSDVSVTKKAHASDEQATMRFLANAWNTPYEPQRTEREKPAIQHGVNCFEIKHYPGQWRHAGDYDGPVLEIFEYENGGVRELLICGRCHERLPDAE